MTTILVSSVRAGEDGDGRTYGEGGVIVIRAPISPSKERWGDRVMRQYKISASSNNDGDLVAISILDPSGKAEIEDRIFAQAIRNAASHWIFPAIEGGDGMAHRQWSIECKFEKLEHMANIEMKDIASDLFYFRSRVKYQDLAETEDLIKKVLKLDPESLFGLHETVLPEVLPDLPFR
ncbi:hypothetical protein [Haloferula luteola]|uniref:hypothetical protein n=1 Tax=Haloferula luteola TaxID=595692 RepID=UPI001C841C52|nr:hypothetical protein [Haloferula luteola]